MGSYGHLPEQQHNIMLAPGLPPLRKMLSQCVQYYLPHVIHYFMMGPEKPATPGELCAALSLFSVVSREYLSGTINASAQWQQRWQVRRGNQSGPIFWFC